MPLADTEDQPLDEELDELEEDPERILAMLDRLGRARPQQQHERPSLEPPSILGMARAREARLIRERTERALQILAILQAHTDPRDRPA